MKGKIIASAVIALAAGFVIAMLAGARIPIHTEQKTRQQVVQEKINFLKSQGFTVLEAQAALFMTSAPYESFDEWYDAIIEFNRKASNLQPYKIKEVYFVSHQDYTMFWFSVTTRTIVSLNPLQYYSNPPEYHSVRIY